MAEPTLSLFDRLMQRRKAIEAGDPTGAAPGPNAAGTRAEVDPRPKPPTPSGNVRSKAASALVQKPGESASAFRLRQIDAAAAAGEL